jgi:hypothetical protein
MYTHVHTLQRKDMLRGLNERQLKMLKAEVLIASRANLLSRIITSSMPI